MRYDDKVYLSVEEFARFLLIDYYKAQSDKETVEQHFYRTVIAPDMHYIGRTIVDLGVWDDHKDLWFASLMAAQTRAYPESVAAQTEKET